MEYKYTYNLVNYPIYLFSGTSLVVVYNCGGCNKIYWRQYYIPGEIYLLCDTCLNIKEVKDGPSNISG